MLQLSFVVRFLSVCPCWGFVEWSQKRGSRPFQMGGLEWGGREEKVRHCRELEHQIRCRKDRQTLGPLSLSHMFTFTYTTTYVFRVSERSTNDPFGPKYTFREPLNPKRLAGWPEIKRIIKLFILWVFSLFFIYFFIIP